MSGPTYRKPSPRPGQWPAKLSAAMIGQVRQVGSPKFSPTGDRVAFVQGYNGRADIFVVPASGGLPVQITADFAASWNFVQGSENRGADFCWSSDGRMIVYRAASDSKLKLVPSDGGPVRPLTIGDGTHQCPASSPDGKSVAYILAREDREDIAIVEVDAAGVSWPVRISRAADFVLAPEWSPDSKALLWTEYDEGSMPWYQTRIVTVDITTRERRVLWEVGGSSGTQGRYSPDGTMVAFLSDESGWRNVWVRSHDGALPRHLVNEEAEHGGPHWGKEERTIAWSPDSRRLAYTVNQRGQCQIWIVEIHTGERRQLTNTPGVHTFLSWSPDATGAYLLCTCHSPISPPEVCLIDVDTGSRRVLTKSAPAAVNATPLVLPSDLAWTSNDKLPIHGLLYAPKDTSTASGAGLPLLVWLHGGPTGQAVVGWQPEIQYFVERGWLVLAPNYRGSTGYGREFLDALHGTWGEADLRDVIAGVTAAAEKFPVDRGRVVAWGESAGGYLVLVCLTKGPEVFRAGVDLYGLSDLATISEQTDREERAYLSALLGPAPDAFHLYRERSPINFADRVQGPLLILHGEADKIVEPAQSWDMIRALERTGKVKGREFDYCFYVGEGHGWLRAETIEDAIATTEGFLQRYVLERSG